MRKAWVLGGSNVNTPGTGLTQTRGILASLNNSVNHNLDRGNRRRKTMKYKVHRKRKPSGGKDFELIKAYTEKFEAERILEEMKKAGGGAGADADKENARPTLTEDERVANALALNDKWKKDYEATKNHGYSPNADLKERKLFFARLLRFILINTKPINMNQPDAVQAIPLDQISSQLAHFFPKYLVPNPQDLCPTALPGDWKSTFLEPDSCLSRLFLLLSFNDKVYVKYNKFALSLSEDEDSDWDLDSDSDSSSPTPIFKIIKYCPNDAEAKADSNLSNIDSSKMLKDDGEELITNFDDDFNFDIDEFVKSVDLH